MIERDEQRLRYLAQKIAVTRRFFDGHDMEADEIIGRIHLDELEFLLRLLTRERMHLAHAAGFLQGMAVRIDRWSKWDAGESDSESFKQTAQECRELGARLAKEELTP